MTEETVISKLYDEAFDLVFAWHDMPSIQAEDRITEFKSQSTEHRLAIIRAEQEWTLLGEIEAKPMSFIQKAQLFIDLKTVSLIDNPQKALPVMVMLLLVAFLPDTGFFKHQQAVAISNASYSTDYGERSDYTLSDGTVLSLNWDTELTVSYTKEQRLVSLVKGEALFTVAKDSARPFIVNVGNVYAKAVGTEFSVHKIREDYADIAVTEGVVEVTVGSVRNSRPKPKIIQLKKSQSVVANDGHVGTVHAFSVDEIKAWQSGMLVFDKRPINEVVAEFNRYTSYNIVMGKSVNKATEQKIVTGTFFIDDIDDAVLSIIQMFDLQSEIFKEEGSSTVVLYSTY